MSSFVGLNIARSSLLAHQVAVEVAGHNLSNVQTQGYSRQRVSMVQGVPSQTTQGSLGSGVRIDQVERLQLGYLERQVARVTVQNGYDASLVQGLDELQSLLGEPSAEGLNAALTAFWNSWDSLAARPTDAALRTQVVERADYLTTVYNRKIEGFEEAEARFDEVLTDALGEVNGRAGEIARLNGAISKSEASGYPANDLRDQRDRAVRLLAGTLGVEVEARDGRVDLRLPGGGPYLVHGAESYELFGSRDAGGRLGSFQVGHSPAALTGGKVGALLTLRDEVSPGLRGEVGHWMSTVADRVNRLHVQGFDRDGLPGRNLLTWQGSATRVAVAPSSGLAAVTTGRALEAGTHHLEVTSVDASLVGNGLGSVASDWLRLEQVGGAYGGAPALGVDYHVRVLGAGGGPAGVEGLRLQLFRGNDPVSPVETAAGAGATFAWTVDGVAFEATVGVGGGSAPRAGDRGHGLSTVGTAALDGGPAVRVDLASTNDLSFTGGSRNGFLAGGVATVTFGAGAFAGGSFTAYDPAGRLGLDPVVAADADQVAAAASRASGDGEMARRIADLAVRRIFEAIGETPAGYLGRTVQSLGAKGRDAEVMKEASTSVLLQLDAQRESVSGVNVDEEMVQLMQYQRGFEAAARFLTTVDGLLETLINRVGLAGR